MNNNVLAFLYDKAAEYKTQPDDEELRYYVDIIKNRLLKNHEVSIAWYGGSHWEDWAIEDEDENEVLIDSSILEEIFNI